MSTTAQVREGLTTFVAARWPAVVRTLVLLGAPADQAQRLAGVAAARLLDAPGWDDPDVALFAEVVRAWEDDASAWWRAAGPSAYADLEPALDRLDPATRARLLLTAVAGLAPEQVDDVVVGGGSWPPDLAPAVAQAAERVATDPPAVAVAADASRARRLRRRTGGVVGVLAAAAVVVGGIAVLSDPTEPLDVSRSLPRPVEVPGAPLRDPVVTVRNDGDVPAPWYDGEQVHLGDVVVPVPGLTTLTAVADGAAGVLGDGTVVVVTADAGLQPLGRARGGSTVAGSTASPGVAWQDADGDLVVARLAPALVQVDLPLGARLLGRSGADTYVGLRDGYLVLPDYGVERRVPGPPPIDVAGDVRVEATATGLRVTSPRRTTDLAGTGAFGARLSADGRYLLTGEVASSSTALSVVVDVRRGRPVRLPIPDDGRIVDATFGAPGTVTMVLSRPGGARFPKTTPRGDGAQPGWDLITCRLRAGTCETAAQLDAVELAPLVAY